MVEIVLVVAGKVNDEAFHKAKLYALALQETQDNVECEIHSLFETEFEEFAQSKAKALNVGRDVQSPLIFYNNKNLIGSTEEFIPWARKQFDFRAKVDTRGCEMMAKSEYRDMVLGKNHNFCYMDIEVGDGEEPDTESKYAAETVHRVIIELFDDIVPKTCENFIQLCSEDSEYNYVGSTFHRVVVGGWVQGGDIETGDGDGGCASNGDRYFGDENFGASHSCTGIISMANASEPNTNGSQFFVTMRDLRWLDQKKVAFGRVQYGMRAFRQIESMKLKNERPQGICRIVGCGLYSPEMITDEDDTNDNNGLDDLPDPEDWI